MNSMEDTQSIPFFLYGYYGCSNLGDDLLLSATIAGILNKENNAIFTIRNVGDVSVVDEFREKIHLSNIECILLKNKSKYRKFIEYVIKSYKLISRSKYFILGGGTLLHATTSNTSLLLLFMQVLIAKLLGLKIIGLGIGAMDLQSYFARILSIFIIILSDDFCFRDIESKSLFPKFVKSRLTADLVYGWWPYNFVNQKSDPNRKVIAISLWSIPPKNEIKILRSLVEFLTEKSQEGYCIEFLAFHNGPKEITGFSDLPAIQYVQEQLDNNNIKSVIKFPSTEPKDIVSLFKNTKIHIGARYHCCLLAALNGVQSIGISTEPKIQSFCKTFSCPELDIHEISLEIINYYFKNFKDKQIDIEMLNYLRTQSINNFDAI